MTPYRRYRCCVICGVRSGRINQEKRKFMARFPLDPDRQWVKVIGNEDLVYIPIDKLHQLKHVCGDHFQPKDFNKKESRLNKWAVPSVGINAQPLSNDLLVEFPCHISKSEIIDFDGAACKIDLPAESGGDQNKIDISFDEDHGYSIDVSEDVQSCQEGEESPTEEPEVQQQLPKEEGPFSWQKVTEDIDPLDEMHSADDDIKFCGEAQLVPDVCEPASQTQSDFSCNVCKKLITGFRYACVQCADWDLCGACEARGEHATHYVLRVPPHRTPSETAAIVTSLRQMLAAAALREQLDLTKVKKEGQTDDLLEVAESPTEELSDGTGYTPEMLEEYLDSSSNEDSDIEMSPSRAPAKRKMAQIKHIHTYSRSKRKCVTDRTQRPVSLLKKDAIRKETQRPISLSKKDAIREETQRPISLLTKDAIRKETQRPISLSKKDGIREETQRPISLLTKDAIRKETQRPISLLKKDAIPKETQRPISLLKKDAIRKEQSQIGNDDVILDDMVKVNQALELSSSSGATSSKKFLLELARSGNSSELLLNMTKLSEGQIVIASRPAGGKR